MHCHSSACLPWCAPCTLLANSLDHAQSRHPVSCPQQHAGLSPDWHGQNICGSCSDVKLPPLVSRENRRLPRSYQAACQATGRRCVPSCGRSAGNDNAHDWRSCSRAAQSPMAGMQLYPRRGWCRIGARCSAGPDRDLCTTCRPTASFS